MAERAAKENVNRLEAGPCRCPLQGSNEMVNLGGMIDEGIFLQHIQQ